MLTASGTSDYLVKDPPSRIAFAAGLLNVLLLAFLIWLAMRWVRPWIRAKLGRAFEFGLACVFALVPLNAVRVGLSDQIDYLQRYLRDPLLFSFVGPEWLGVAAALLAAPGLFLFWCWGKPVTRITRGVLLILFPMVPLTFIEALWAMSATSRKPAPDGVLATPLPVFQSRPHRVLWLVYDELDYRLVFTDRPGGIALPELDRLRRQAVFGERAYPPGRNTLLVLPSLITGRPLSAARSEGSDKLSLRLREEGYSVNWGSLPNVFSKARQMGLNTALVGWYHPYCRVLAPDLTSCWWCETDGLRNSLGKSFREIFPNQIRRLVETSQFSPFGQSLVTLRHAATYQEILAHAREVAADRAVGLALVHFPIPQGPFFYDRASGQYTLANSAVSGYIDSLVLVDHSLGALRQAMEARGIWEDTAVLLSSDHACRFASALDGKSDDRVPFLLKLAGQRKGVACDLSFNTVVSQDLLLAVLRREVATPESALGWLRGNASRDAGPASATAR